MVAFFGTDATKVKVGLGTVPIPDCAGEQKEVLWIDLRHGGFGVCEPGPLDGKGCLATAQNEFRA